MYSPIARASLSKPPGIPRINATDPIHTNCTFLVCPGASPWSLIPSIQGVPQNGAPQYSHSLLGKALQLVPANNNGLDWGLAPILDGATSASISFWIYIVSNTAGRLFTRWGNDFNSQLFLFAINSGPTIAFATTNLGGFNIGETPNLAVGTQYHCVTRWFPPNTIEFLINASLKTTNYSNVDSIVSMKASGTSSLQMGYETNEAQSPPDVYVDCIRVWRNRLLTSAEVMRLYAEPWAGLLWPRDHLQVVRSIVSAATPAWGFEALGEQFVFQKSSRAVGGVPT